MQIFHVGGILSKPFKSGAMNSFMEVIPKLEISP